MVDPLATVGGLSGVAGIVGFIYQVWRKRVEKEALKREKEEVQAEKEDLKLEKDEYEQVVEETRAIIGDLQEVATDGSPDQAEVQDILDRLEETVLPVEDRILSRLGRLQTQVRKHDVDDEHASE